MHEVMMPKEIDDLVNLLYSYTRVEPDDGQCIMDADGTVIPPVPFTSFPLLR